MRTHHATDNLSTAVLDSALLNYRVFQCACSGDIVGFSGNDPGVILAVPAGSVIVFSSLTLHGSGDNLSLLPRRALNLAFTQQHEQEGQERNAAAVPFLANGKVVSALSSLLATVKQLP